jgi:alpha-glucosidase
LPVPSTANAHNVADELKDSNSILSFYKKVIALRRTNRELREGNYVPLNQNDPNVLSYLRVYQDQAVLVALNMSGTPQKVDFKFSKNGFASAKSLVATANSSSNGDIVALEPYGVFIAQLMR